jgi:hypothetical protein
MRETVPPVVGFHLISKVLPAVIPVKSELVKELSAARANRGEAKKATRV